MPCLNFARPVYGKLEEKDIGIIGLLCLSLSRDFNQPEFNVKRWQQDFTYLEEWMCLMFPVPGVNCSLAGRSILT